MEDNKVVLSLDEYTTMHTAVVTFSMMADALFDAARLDYSKEKLTINYDVFSAILNLCMHDTYTARLHELQREREDKEQ